MCVSSDDPVQGNHAFKCMHVLGSTVGREPRQLEAGGQLLSRESQDLLSWRRKRVGTGLNEGRTSITQSRGGISRRQQSTH